VDGDAFEAFFEKPTLNREGAGGGVVYHVLENPKIKNHPNLYRLDHFAL
jgi:hypothetical protein